MVSQDHESTWMERFKGRCSPVLKGPSKDQARSSGAEIGKAVLGGKRQVEEQGERSTKRLKDSMICLKAMFTLFREGQGRLPERRGIGCKFIHAKKKSGSKGSSSLMRIWKPCWPRRRLKRAEGLGTGKTLVQKMFFAQC